MNEQEAGPPPGWYPHPSMAGTQRYWDGAAWTDHVAPAQQQPLVVQSDRSWMLPVGYSTAVLFPAVGFIIGCALPKQYDRHQVWMILLSLGSAFFYYLWLAGYL